MAHCWLTLKGLVHSGELTKRFGFREGRWDVQDYSVRVLLRLQFPTGRRSVVLLIQVGFGRQRAVTDVFGRGTVLRVRFTDGGGSCYTWTASRNAYR